MWWGEASGLNTTYTSFLESDSGKTLEAALVNALERGALKEVNNTLEQIALYKFRSIVRVPLVRDVPLVSENFVAEWELLPWPCMLFCSSREERYFAAFCCTHHLPARC